MEKKIKHRKWECFWCKNTLNKKDFIKKWQIFICSRCGYWNSESIFNSYKTIETPQLTFWIDTQESIKKSLKTKSKKWIKHLKKY